jgi:hypothetical protein
VKCAGRERTKSEGREGKVPVQTFWNRRWREVWIRTARLRIDDSV